MNLNELRSRIAGIVTSSTDKDYENLRTSGWNHPPPDRRPRYIVQVANENDVVEAVGFARANQLKIAVRGGGHSWVSFFLRDDGLLIDLGRLKQVSINREARRAVVQPAVTGRELNQMLDAQGLMFPVGHCPTVPMSGFLLSGGFGWNHSELGQACFSVEAARVVTADGGMVVASEKANSDLLWAVRGGGPGFFGVVTEYTLKLYPAPAAITSSNYYYPIERIEEVGEWAGSIARKLPRQVEFVIMIIGAPPPIADRCKASNGFVCVVSGTAFADSPSAAASMLQALDTCPILDSCLMKELNAPATIDALHDLTLLLQPEHHRYLSDNLWTNSAPGKVLGLSREHFLRAPSPKAAQVFILPTGERRPLPDAAYSMTGDALLMCYATWESPEDDAVNRAWHQATIAALDQHAIGHYVGESDIVGSPDRAARSYAPANWQRLNKLRQQWDPEGLFHGHFSRA
jgi:FAD/FMN-containing dehydrogenase